jgi:hypothetical protein
MLRPTRGRGTQPQPPDVLLCLLIRQYLEDHTLAQGGTPGSAGAVRDDLTKLANFLSTCLLSTSGGGGGGALEPGPASAGTGAGHRGLQSSLATAAIESFQGALRAPKSFPWLRHPAALREQLFQVLSPPAATAVFASVQARLSAITSPDGVADLFGELKSLVYDHIERDSTCGRYLRRQILDFERQMFGGVSHLFNGLQAMTRAPPPRPWEGQSLQVLPAPPTFSDAVENLHRAFDRLINPLGSARRLGVTQSQHASLHLGALHLSQGQYQSAVTGGVAGMGSLGCVRWRTGAAWGGGLCDCVPGVGGGGLCG